MYSKILTLVTVTLSGLLVLVAVIVTDVHDRDFPISLGAVSRIGLDFSESGLSDEGAEQRLATESQATGTALLREVPDLESGSGRVFVPMGGGGRGEVPWFNGAVPSPVVGRERLANSSPSGTYLVVGEAAGLDELVAGLESDGVVVHRTDASVTMTAVTLVGGSAFFAPVAASCALIATLVIFWLAVRARSRALRLIAGAPVTRIQRQDLAQLFGPLVLVSAVAHLCALVGVGTISGWRYVASFAAALGGLQAIMLGVALLTSIALFAVSWPTAEMVVRRLPTVRRIRVGAAMIQVMVFVLLISAAGPAWTAVQTSTKTSRDLALWRDLADEVSLVFAMPENELEAVTAALGALVRDAEDAGVVALSYSFAEAPGGFDDSRYSSIAIVDQRWVGLMGGRSDREPLHPVRLDAVVALLDKELVETLSLWAPIGLTGTDVLESARLFAPGRGSTFPVLTGGGSGQLDFREDVLIVAVDSIGGALDDDTITSLASTGNLIFSGADRTVRLLERHGLDPKSLRGEGFEGTLRPVYVAERGILDAQVAAFEVWISLFSTFALVIAFSLSASTTAAIAALTHARRDFALRLAGYPWWQVLEGRVRAPLLIGLSGGAFVLAATPAEERTVTGAVTLVAIGTAWVCHRCAVPRAFSAVSRRQL